MCDFLPSQLATMTFNNIEIKIESSIKFLGDIIDENLTWKNHIKVVENKISKNIGVLYRVIHLLDFKNLLKIYFSLIHIYISFQGVKKGCIGNEWVKATGMKIKPSTSYFELRGWVFLSSSNHFNFSLLYYQTSFDFGTS